MVDTHSSAEGDLNSGYAYREQVGAGSEGLSVLQHLVAHHRHSTEAQWGERLDLGELELDGERARASDSLRAGQWLVWNRPPWSEPRAPLSFEVLYEDEALVAVGKPSGLPTLPGAGFLEHTLLSQVQRRYPGAAPAHRLGRATSGIVLFSRAAAFAAILQEAWRSGRIEKTYRALAEGEPEPDCFDIDAPIGPVPYGPTGTVHAASPAGRAARSTAKVLERRGGSAVVEVRIHTGRPHQIRIHLAHAGHPLVGDPLYGVGGTPRAGTSAVPGDPGYLLHAVHLALPHPVTGQRLEVRCAPPAALRMATECSDRPAR